MALLLSLVLAGADPEAALEDPYAWLEEVEGPKALDWVEARNRETLEALQSDPRFEKFQRTAEELLEDKERIPYGRFGGGFVYNFWQDESHVRGVWRRATLEEYLKEAPEWETLLDVDALASREGENWVFKAAVLREPDYERAMIVLSRGGADASVWREFDLATKSFPAHGFVVPQAKTRGAWFGPDLLAVATDFGEGSLTTSGYPRFVKLWTRGTPLDAARTVYQADPTDVGVQASVSVRPDAPARLITRSIAFFLSEHFLLQDPSHLVRIPMPASADLSAFFDGAIYFTLRDPLPDPSGATAPKGAIVRIGLNEVERGESPQPEAVFSPAPRQSVQAVAAGRTRLNVAMLNDVAGEVRRYGEGRWQSLPLPPNGTASIVSADEESDRLFVGYTDFLTPPRLYLVDGPDAEPRLIKSLPPRFDAEGFAVERRDAVSRDGERVPYFLVRRKDARADGRTPTLLYAYGGFEVPMLPSYSATIGRLWLEQGGAYVLACIRGGGEFGPDWHQAALREHRQRAYDDFLAVAEDLIATKATSPRRLGIMGGSNGGLLVGAAFTQRPDLFGAVVCSVPLLDMLRYTKLLAGASWIAEYGDPDDPAMHKALRAYSPYHNVRADAKYPRVFFETSTKDDRVHPGHARKMVAKMRDQGHAVYYFENTEGGHSAAANLRQRARRTALEFVYLHRMLMDP